MIPALQRHFLRLHRMRSALDAGRPLDDVLRQLRPPPHFKQRDAFEQQCRDWRLPKLNAALATIAETAKRARLTSTLDTVLAEHLLLDWGCVAEASPGLSSRPCRRGASDLHRQWQTRHAVCL